MTRSLRFLAARRGAAPGAGFCRSGVRQRRRLTAADRRVRPAWTGVRGRSFLRSSGRRCAPGSLEQHAPTRPMTANAIGEGRRVSDAGRLSEYAGFQHFLRSP
jgi:hypothetical protein